MASFTSTPEISVFVGDLSRQNPSEIQNLNLNSSLIINGQAGVSYSAIPGGVNIVTAEVRSREDEVASSLVKTFFDQVNIAKSQLPFPSDPSDLLRYIFENFGQIPANTRMDVLSAIIYKTSNGFQIKAAGIGAANLYFKSGGTLQPIIKYPFIKEERIAAYAIPFSSRAKAENVIYTSSSNVRTSGLVVSGGLDLRGINFSSANYSNASTILGQVISMQQAQYFVDGTVALAAVM